MDQHARRVIRFASSLVRRPRAVAIACWAVVTAQVVDGRAQDAGDDQELEVTVRGPPAAGFTSRASTDDAPAPPVDAAALIARLPSVHVRRLGADGSFATLTVRGAATSQVAVLLGDVPLTSAADPAADVGALPLWPGASYRVHRGFAPARLGATGYLGGALVIDPPSRDLGDRTESWWTVGSFGAAKLRVGDVRAVGDLGLGTGVYASRSDGDFTYEAPEPGSGKLRERVRDNAGHLAAGIIERITVERPWGGVGATVFADVRRTELPGRIEAPQAWARLDTSRVVLALDARLRSSRSGAWHVAGWRRHEHAHLVDPRGELDDTGVANSADQSIDTIGGSFGWRGRLVEPLTVDVFADGRLERFEDATDGGARRIAPGLGTDLAWRVSPPLSLNAAARFDLRFDRATGALGASGERLGDSFEAAPSAHGGAALRLSPAATLAAHGGTVRRPPSFVELYGNRGTLRGNPDLSPERSVGGDAGVQGATRLSSVRLDYELVGFASTVDDLITFLPSGIRTFEAQNVDRAVVYGGELALALSASAARTTVVYTLLVTENLGEGARLPGRPVHDLAYQAGWRFGPLDVEYRLDAVAESTVDVGGTIELPPRVLHGMAVALDVPGVRGLRASVQVDNLFDLRTLYVLSPLQGRFEPVPVSDFLGFPLPGRTVWASIGYRVPQ